MENVIIIGIIVVFIVIGIRSGMKHFKGEGGCCGGSAPAPKQHKKLKNVIAKKTIIIEGMKGSVSFHDFRIVHGPTHTNLIFDVLVPYDYEMSDGEIETYIEQKVKEIDESYFVVIEIDKAYARGCK